jgi:hypothetical protein
VYIHSASSLKQFRNVASLPEKRQIPILYTRKTNQRTIFRIRDEVVYENRWLAYYVQSVKQYIKKKIHLFFTFLLMRTKLIFYEHETDSQVFLLKSVICHVLPLRYQKQNPNIKRNKCLYFQLFIPVLCLHPDCIFNLLSLQTRVLCGRPVFER